MHFMAFSKGQCTEREYFKGCKKSFFFFFFFGGGGGVCLVIQIFWGYTLDAGSRPTYEEKK